MQTITKKPTIASKPTERPPMRPDLRDDPREAAKRRSEEIRKHLGGIDDVIDDFYVDESVIPEGWSYEWKRHTLMGQQDPAYQIQLARMGWTPVPATRHPDMMPINTKYDTIERKGMVLMERPVEITEEVRRIDNKRARDQVRVKEQQLTNAPDGQFTRDHERVKPRIKKGYEPIEIPSND
ncbi:hypothetical protein UFOVP661_54 [uncultured Caudovirales phage]|uniref:Uncharacterized protein n=1 Tax=uncultured Caudovirales phage TaxID=2100421 RepID=A0A6J5NGT4_9CAUD|nr:hypothetical protein UFOVP661_54 [uncultured Caudovirales phage]